MSERSMRALMKLIAQRIGLTYRDVVSWLESVNSLPEIEARILAGNYAQAIVSIDDAAKKIASEITESYITSGRTTAKWLDSKVKDKLVRFDSTESRVVQRARANELELVQGFREEQYQVARQITQRAMIEGAQDGINPRRVAQDFRASIGLTPTQEEHVASYRRSLEQGDFANVMRRELHDDRANRLLRGVRDRGESLTEAQVVRYTEQYRQSYVNHRATTIARTEALRNANAGAGDAIDQAIARGEVDAAELVKTWHAGPATPSARSEHQALDEVSVGVNEDFVLGDGTRMARPGDPRGGAENTASCRCTVSVSFA